MLNSVNGVLKTPLVESIGTVMLDGQPVTGAWTYNGSIPGPTLHVNPGDLLDLTVVNNLPEPTNLHTHGLHVSPIGNSDNVFISIEPGASFEYNVQLPADHEQGLFWYHPHNHGFVDDQIFRGVSGLLVVGDAAGGAPELNGMTRHLLGIRNIQTTAPISSGTAAVVPLGTTENTSSPNMNLLVNGQLDPVITMTSGESQVWNVANIGNDLFMNLQLVNGANVPQTIYLVAEDGQAFTRPVAVTSIFLDPGKRYSFIVQGGAPGTYQLNSLGFNSTTTPRQLGPHSWPAASNILTLNVVGPLTPPAPVPTQLTPPNNSFEELRNASIAASRTVVFSQDVGPGVTNPGFLVNGQVFPNPPLFQPRLNTVEEWTIVNVATEDHPFHIHTNDFEVISMNGVPVNSQSYQDILDLPGTSNPSNPTVAVIRMKFLDYLGRYVYHCHVADHEDMGMMGIVEIIPENPIYATGADAGGVPEVKVFDTQSGQVKFDFMAYDPAFTGGVRVAVGDVNGDGVPDIITSPGPGGGPLVKVFSGKDASLILAFNAYDPGFQAGVFVAAGPVNTDHFSAIITAPDAGGGSLVKVFRGTDANLLLAFDAYDPGFQGGVRVAAGIVVIDGFASIITAPGAGGGPLIRTFSGLDGMLMAAYNAYDAAFLGGVFVASGNLNDDAYDEIITAPGAGGGPLVEVFGTFTQAYSPTAMMSMMMSHEAMTFPTMLFAAFNAYDESTNPLVGTQGTTPTPYASGLRVGVANFSNDGRADILVGTGPGEKPLVKLFDFQTLALIDDFFAYDPLFQGGLFAGGV